MELGSATVPVLVVAVCVETRERGRIGHPFVEVANFLAAVHLGPPRISGLSARPFNVERQRRQVESLPPEAEQGGSVHPSVGLVHHRQRLVEGKGVGFLNGREVLEGRRPLRRKRLRAIDHGDVVDVPFPV
jgi:hypothetical protein